MSSRTVSPYIPVRTRLVSRRSRAGMTLVEIMVVIAVIGLLMSVVAINVVGQLDEANVETTRLTMKRLDQGLQTYAVKHKGKFPPTSEGLDSVSKYFPDNRLPTDAWGNSFQYFSPGTRSGRDYEIISLGKDGQEGGDSTNADILSWESPDDG